MIRLKSIYQFSFYLVALIVFLFGGLMQFFFGVSSTGLTIGLCCLMLFNYFLYVMVHKRIVINKIVLIAILYCVTIVLSGFINNSPLINIVVYCLFPLLPLSVFLFFYINYENNFIVPKAIYKIIFFIALIQLPILLIQRYFYDILIIFNHSGQTIKSFDFLFGSFLLKSDHSLGCFLLFTTISLLFNISGVRKYIKFPIIIAIYLSISLLFSESNISKALLVLTWVVFLVNYLQRMIPRELFTRKFFLVFVLSLFALGFYNIRNIELITSKVGGTFENHYTVEKSTRFFYEGTAKREQIVIFALSELDTKYIGDGPYSYFDIRTGEFKNTIHFSQIIWTYFDLGLVGLILIFLYAYYLIKYMVPNNRKMFFSLLFLTGIYMFYTTPFSEIGILFNLFLFFNIKSDNECNNYSFPRLEKK